MFKILTAIGIAMFSFAWAWQNTQWIMSFLASKGIGEVKTSVNNKNVVSTSNISSN